MPAEASETTAAYTARTKTSPPRAIIDLYFLDARHKLLEIAAFLDRIERARAAHAGSPDAMPEDDFRLKSFKEALAAVAGPAPDKTKTAQKIFSDPTTEPLESAAGMKGACGAWKGK